MESTQSTQTTRKNNIGKHQRAECLQTWLNHHRLPYAPGSFLKADSNYKYKRHEK